MKSLSSLLIVKPKGQAKQARRNLMKTIKSLGKQTKGTHDREANENPFLHNNF